MIPTKARTLNIKSVILSFSQAEAASRITTPCGPSVFYVAWRTRRNHPWQSAEFASHAQAEERYNELVNSGAEAYLETRQRRFAA